MFQKSTHAPIFSIFHLRIGDGLPLHIARIVRTASAQRLNRGQGGAIH
jgi:hypothetical protein